MCLREVRVSSRITVVVTDSLWSTSEHRDPPKVGLFFSSIPSMISVESRTCKLPSLLEATTTIMSHEAN